MRSNVEAWRVRTEEYPRDGSASEQLEFLVRYAILAPSNHNAQPWLFRVDGDSIYVYTDESRALPIIDADGRQRFMSCGAALFNLRLAIRRFGHDITTTLQPDPRDPSLVAVVQRGPASPCSQETLQLFDAIAHRHTNRRPFLLRPVSATIAASLASAVRAERAWLERLHPTEKYQAAELIAEADREQYGDKAFRRELARWLRPHASRKGDGIPTSEKAELGAVARYAAPLVVRTFDIGGSVGARELQLAAGSPVLAVLGTGIDTPTAWICAGQGMQRMLLTARRFGLSASFLNQPLELEKYRERFTQMTRHGGYPQLLLRIGYAAEEAGPTPRRPLEDTLLPGGTALGDADRRLQPEPESSVEIAPMAARVATRSIG